jgi:hypothetical protein
MGLKSPRPSVAQTDLCASSSAMKAPGLGREESPELSSALQIEPHLALLVQLKQENSARSADREKEKRKSGSSSAKRRESRQRFKKTRGIYLMNRPRQLNRASARQKLGIE